MSLSTAVKYISLSLEMTKTGILSAMEYRISFLTQVVGMIINDTAFIVIWVIFFQKFPEVKGWRIQDMAMLMSLSTINYSIVMIFGRGAFELARTIARGELDYYLSFPKNVMWHVAVSKTEIPAIGDLVFGIIIFFFTGDVSFSKAGLLALMSIVTAFIIFNFIMITQSITFFIGNFEEAAEQMFFSLLGFTLYPQTVFYGGLKIIMLTIIPAFFISSLPVRLIRQFDITFFIILILFSIATFILSVYVFKKGLRRYESGNLINLKM